MDCKTCKSTDARRYVKDECIVCYYKRKREEDKNKYSCEECNTKESSLWYKGSGKELKICSKCYSNNKTVEVKASKEHSCISCNTDTTSKWYGLRNDKPTCRKCYKLDLKEKQRNLYECTECDSTDSPEWIGKKTGNIICHKCDSQNKYYEDYERTLKIRQEYRTKNRAKLTAFENNRRAKKIEATPKWSDLDKIQQIYEKARDLKLEVDHIIPLRGKNVSGLNIPENLQLLNRSDNSSKNNRFDGTNENDSWRK